MSTESTWIAYNSAGANATARPRLLRTLQQFFPNKNGRALDLGCGGGRDTKELLSRGWHVDAVDNDENATLLTSSLKTSFQNLEVIRSSFESLNLPQSSYDLINGSYSLPFCKPEHFAEFWQKLKAALKPGGIISCELFGINDTWRTNPIYERKMVFFSKAEIENYLSDMTVEILEESEHEGPTFSGPTKHWHLFVCVARRP